jgi:hypothetical protein
MINPYSPPILPGAHGQTPQRNKDHSGVENFAAWLEPGKDKPAPPADAVREDMPGRNFLETVLTQEAPHPLDIPHPEQPLPVAAMRLQQSLLADSVLAQLSAIVTNRIVETSLPGPAPTPTPPVPPSPTPPVPPSPTPIEVPAIISEFNAIFENAAADGTVPTSAELTAAIDASIAPIEQAVAGIVANVMDRASVSAAGERVDFVAVLWHLTANAGLSYRSVLAELLQADGGPLVNPSTMPANASGRSESAIRAAHPMIEGAERQAIATHRLEVEAALREARRADATTGALNAATQRAGWAPLLTWPQRVLRWLGDGEGTTAWVRDYQIDLSKLESLVDSLRCLADQQGVPLRRIMLNGHELWRSPTAN